MNDSRIGAFYSGTSGLELPVPNKEFYPPEFRDKSRLEYYASLYNSIEINSSFYKVPMPSTVRKWSELVPDNFRFTFKLWKQITHNKGLEFSHSDVAHFIDTINQAGNKKGALLIQFPPGLKISSFRQLQKLLTAINDADSEHCWKIAVEFRESSWYHDEVFDLLDELEATVVMHDKPGSITPAINSNESFKYLRFHGPDGNYKGHYEDDLLQDYAELITQWIQEKKTVFCYFNNTAGDANGNLKTLNTFVTNYMK